MWNDLTRPVIIAHRGDRAFAPENTLAAFKQAADKGADAIEFDVKLTADGEVVVLHDQTVDRTTTGRGDVSKITLADLRQLDASVQFPGQFPSEKIPTLAEVFEAVGDRLYMNIELTNYATPGDQLVQKVVDVIKKFTVQPRILFSSFYALNLRKASKLLPDVPRGLLIHEGIKGRIEHLLGWKRDDYALHPYVTDVTPALVDRYHALGKLVNVWTVNQEKDIKNMIGWGVDGIITDDPALVLGWLGRSG